MLTVLLVAEFSKLVVLASSKDFGVDEVLFGVFIGVEIITSIEMCLGDNHLDVNIC